MKVIASTLLTLLAAAPSAIATNQRRRLGAAADVADIDNQSFSMDLIEGAAAEYDDDSSHHGKKLNKEKSTEFLMNNEAPTSTQVKDESDVESLVVDALIVGGGWAGVSAAKELMDNGFNDFLVLEAEGYVGGRSKTYNMEDGSINQHPFDVLSETNIPLEVGSEWLYDGGDIVDYLRFETNLLDRVDMKDENDYWLPLDHSQFYRQFEDGGNATRLSKEESDELYSSVLQKFNNFRSGLSGDYTLQDALDLFLGQDHQGVDEQYLQLVLDAATIEYGSDLDNFKFKKKLRYFHSDNMYYLGRVGVGFGNTVRAVADDFMDKIEMEAQVTSIDYTDPENVKVSYTKNRIRHNIIAKSVLVTVSLGVLKANAIKFTPRLPKDKQDAIAGSSMGTVNKAILIWDDTNVEIPNEQWFSLITPESNTSGQWTTFLNPTQYKGGVTTIVAWIGGEDATRMESKPNELILEEVMSHLQAIYPTLPEPDKAYISKWGKEQNFKGSYSSRTYGRSHSQDSFHLSEKVGRVSFAGEATAYPNYATTKGAYASGTRGAKEMIEVLNLDLAKEASSTVSPVESPPTGQNAKKCSLQSLLLSIIKTGTLSDECR